ncbi:MAG TPA: hypothetical protein VKR30_04660 [Candidatus Limnocylindrales bacterium]|nr:hypothetical protein [Candidatus Limnocylindrales bacterium]
MDDPRHEPGMPVLDRQAAPGAAVPGGAVPGGPRPGPGHVVDRVPEIEPTPLQRQYIYLSTVALVCGAIAITALEIGAPLDSLLVKACVLIGTPLLLLANLDASLRIWRSAWAWMPVDRGRGLFRLAWVGAAAIGLGIIAAGALLVLAA